MNKKWKAKWVRALRSGEYKQTTGVLKSSTGYCCLGVLRELIEPGSTKVDGNYDYLCDEHAALAQIDMKNQRKLAVMNDDEDSFELIANYIEQHL